MSQEKKIMNAFGWQSINVFSQSILQLIFMSILARLISPESFGVMAIVLMITGFIDIFAQIGIGPAIIQRKDITPKQISSGFYLSSLLGLCFFGLVWVLAPKVASYYEYAEFTDLLRVIGISFLISAVSIVPKSLLYKKLRFKELFISGFFGMLTGNIIIGLLLAFLDFEIWAYVAALLVQNGVMTFFYWWYNPIKLDPKPTLKHAAPLVKYGGGSTLFNLFNYLSSKVDIFIVGTYSNLNQASEVAQSSWGTTGVYDQSLRVMSYPITIIGKLSDSVMFSGLSMIQDQTEKLRYAFRTAFSVLTTISLPASVFLVVYAQEVVLIILGDQYYGAIPIVQILFIGLFLRTIIKLCDAVVRALDRVYTGALVKFIYFIAIAISVYIIATDVSVDLGINMGLQGVAIALLVSVALQFLIMLSICISILGLNLTSLLRLLYGPISIAVFALIYCLGFRYVLEYLNLPVLINFLIGTLALALAYLSVIWFMPGVFGRGEHNMLNVLLRKLPAKSIIKRLQERVEKKTTD
ncbi:MAG: lipopolysaccharide biosynthesis protein [Flavobacteriales bacterium]